MKPIDSAEKVIVNSPSVKYGDEFIESVYRYTMSTVKAENNTLVVTPTDVMLRIKTARRVPTLGVMLVGWGGNNGSTLTAGLLANKHGMTWETKEGTRTANWFGSITQSSTFKVGIDAAGKDVYTPMSSLLPLVHPDDIIIDGWDISSDDLADAMHKARVLDYNLQQKLVPFMKNMKPRPSIFIPDFVAPNQAERANNVIQYKSKKEAVEKIRADIRDFKAKSRVDTVIVLWTANTERMCDVHVGKNDTADNLLKAVDESYSEISPSTLFAIASILEGCTYINGSPQNTFVPGCIELAERYNTFIGGDDFKSGQTKLKSVLVDFLVSAGIKPVSIVSYNHLGNNDGRNLDAPKTFRSKEISKSNVIDDMVDSNSILYKDHKKPDHCVVIKYVPYVGDSKRALDEYISELFMGGSNTISIHNTCEDSLLASPIILDLVILGELCSRIQFYQNEGDEPMNFHVILSLLSYLLKAPLVPEGTPVVNSLFRQRACIENVLKACIGLPPDNNMSLEHKLPKQAFASASLQADWANVLKTKPAPNGVCVKSKGAIPVA